MKEDDDDILDIEDPQCEVCDMPLIDCVCDEEDEQ